VFTEKTRMAMGIVAWSMVLAPMALMVIYCFYQVAIFNWPWGAVIILWILIPGILIGLADNWK